ncbi:MAG: InlB B-repeat-containing protein, partial [Clostridia bacterium]|nr:InlB B-repeat-containing protein [Clostridia bacterium]
MTVRKWNYMLRTLIVVLLVAVIGFTFVACGQNNSTPVKGVYYYDGEGENYQVTLSENFGFTLIANDDIRSGEYFYDGENMRLVFSKEEEAAATLKNGMFKLTYNGATFNMLQRINYTVSFDTDGGSTVPAQTVLNGKTANMPADPTRENSRFLGWYADSAFTAPFSFDTQIISQDTTVYARWASKAADQAEFIVNFDANYQGA